MDILHDTSLTRQQADKVRDGIYAFDRLPDEIQPDINATLLNTALEKALKIHAAIRNPEPTDRTAYDRLCKAIKA